MRTELAPYAARVLGEAAVNEGLPRMIGMRVTSKEVPGAFWRSSSGADDPWGKGIPDVNDPYTAKCFEIWAEGWAERVLGPMACVRVTKWHNGAEVRAWDASQCAAHLSKRFAREAYSVPEACVLVVRALKEAAF